MKYPSRRTFHNYFKRLPWWVIPLILILLFGRFVLIFFWHR